MKTIIFKLSFVFLLFIGLNNASIAQTIDQTSVEVLPSTFDDNSLTYGQGIELRFNVYFDFNVCGEEMNLKVTVPSRVNTSQISLAFSEVFEASVVEQIDNPDDTRTINILLKPGPDFTSTSIFTTTLFRILGVTMPASGCGQESIPVRASLITSSPTDAQCVTSNSERLMNIIASSESLSLGLYFQEEQSNIGYDRNIDPFSAVVKILKNRYSYSLQSKFDVRIDIGNALMTVREITVSDTRLPYNKSKIIFQQNGSIITFSTQNLNGVNWNELSYRIYFDLNCGSTGNEASITTDVKVTPYLTCTQQAGTPLTLNRSYNYICFDDTDRLIKPTINYTTTAVCMNNCDQTNLVMEIDNTFNNSALGAFDYYIDINDDVYLNSLSTDAPFGSYPVNQSASGVSYKLCGSDEWVTSYSLNPSFYCGNKVDSLKISYTGLPAGTSSDIRIDFRYDDKDCASNPVQPGNSPMTSFFVMNDVKLTSKNLIYTKQNCSIGAIQDFYETSPGSYQFSSYSQLKSKNEYYVNVSLYVNNASINDYTFTYQLNPNITWANQDVQFAISSQYYAYIGDYRDATNARIDYAAEMASMTYSIVGDKLIVRHLNLSNNCRLCDNNGQKYINVLIKIKPSAYALAGQFKSAFLDCQSVVPCNLSTFGIDATAAASTELYIDCENLTKVRNSDIRLKQNFNYNFVCVNKGNGLLKDIVAIFGMPDVNSKLTYSNINSQTEYKISRDCNPSPENQIRAYEVDPLGNTVGQPIAITVDYLSKSELCALDFDIATETSSCNGPGGSAQWSTNSCNQNTVTYMRFRTPAGFVLGPYNQLVIKAPFITPAGVALGRKATQSFVAKATYVDANQLTTRTNFMRSNSLVLTLATRSSCEPPVYECKDCVTSFSPIPGEKYLLSAWVKEEYINQYPDTYKNSAIRLTFNDGEFKLADMKGQGPIIDGWQRINAEFIVPQGAYNITVNLLNLNPLGGGDVYFDDIRVHPFRSNMKSFVYNPSTQKLTAELDENNYATLYEYDDEGILIRVKKETERGVMTIKETRMNQSKINVGQ